METLKEILIVYGRIITILPLLLFLTLFMGKRSIGELPVFDFLIIITLGAVVGADIADPKIEHLPTAMAVIALAIFQKIISKLLIKYRKFGKALTFEPTLVIKDGVFLNENLRKINYSLDNILQMLREKEIFDLSIVQVALIEANGKLSVFKTANKSTITREDLKLYQIDEGITFPVIMEGKIDNETLSKMKKDESWLREQLKRNNITLEEVFYASLDKNLKLHISPRNNSTKVILSH